MAKKDFKYIYGPVPSWRLGSSLGIDLLSQEGKICNFNCIYCQLGENLNYTQERKLYVPTEEIIKELRMLPEVHIDYITFSGRGEPTLAINLGKTITAVKKLRKEPIATLTNGVLIERKDVREELSLADFVAVKLDAPSRESLEKINRPAPGIRLENILNGIKEFRKEYTGKLALQIMFIDENAGKLAQLAHEIHPDEVQINTPLRACPVKPLSPSSINKIKKQFEGLNIISVYDVERRKVKPISAKDTLKRRGEV